MATIADLTKYAAAYSEATYFDVNDPRRDDPAAVERLTFESNRQAQFLTDAFIATGIASRIGAAADLLAGALDSGDPVYLEHIARQAVADLRRLLGA